MKCELHCVQEATVEVFYCHDMETHPEDKEKLNDPKFVEKNPRFIPRLVPAYSWKLDPQTVRLCKDCSDDLWADCHVLVNLNRMNWRNRPITNES